MAPRIFCKANKLIINSIDSFANLNKWLYLRKKLNLKSMKKSLFIMFAIVATILVSCSKDAKINRRIDGEWKVISIGGEALAADEIYTFKFNKDKKETGDGTIVYTDSFGTESTPFTYTVASEKITLIVDGYSEVLSVTKYEKDKLELIDSSSEVWVLDPK